MGVYSCKQNENFNRHPAPIMKTLWVACERSVFTVIQLTFYLLAVQCYWYDCIYTLVSYLFLVYTLFFWWHAPLLIIINENYAINGKFMTYYLGSLCLSSSSW